MLRIVQTHLESAASPAYSTATPSAIHAIFLVPTSITSGDSVLQTVATTMPPLYVTAADSAPAFEHEGQRGGITSLADPADLHT